MDINKNQSKNYFYFSIIIGKNQINNFQISINNRNKDTFNCSNVYKYEILSGSNINKFFLIYKVNFYSKNDILNFYFLYDFKNLVPRKKILNINISNKKLNPFQNLITLININFDLTKLDKPKFIYETNIFDVFNHFYIFSKELDNDFKYNLFKTGFQHLIDLFKNKSKYSLNFFLQLLSLVSDYEKLIELLNYFDIDLIEDNVPKFEIETIIIKLINQRDEYFLKFDHLPGLKFDLLISYTYLILNNTNSIKDFILKSPYKNTLLLYIQENIDYFNEKVDDFLFLDFLLNNCHNEK